MTKPVKITLLTLVVVAALVALGAALATHMVVGRINDVLGDQGHAEQIHVGLDEIVLENVEIGAPPDWPARQTLRAARVVVIPQWRSLLSDEISLERITVSDYYLTLLRPRNGAIRYLPTLREHRDEEASGTDKDGDGTARRRAVNIDKLELRNGHLDFYDAAVATPPYKVPLDELNADIGPVRQPASDQHTQLHAQGQMVGKNRRGKMELEGWVALPSHDADIQVRLRSVDVALVAPYLQRRSPAALAGGLMDLDMRTQVQKDQLHAQGHITLTDLKFADGDAPLLALPRKAVLAAMEDHKGKVSFDFSLAGNLHDPKFSMDESLAMRVTAGFAKVLGVSVEGVAGGVGDAVKGLGDALDGLLKK
ncbi:MULTISPECIES: DUF748 domain-containing protein [unclassified Achromobacter]|uniref:DUF748 domain-containing protein n=1 Tax=unclassified Achromobacter TaxID=2626865 RepID=UPI000B5152F8|nr:MULTISPECIES: DUF748 domain-containing protein [unclassified Achromobacter]OWT68868.1 hypothetical protein CEY04_29185 [Achromobacter sp. HZ28]OWT78569.1 hypothetical protein CEY05_11865 [Achromobacter sp. HZ34]